MPGCRSMNKERFQRQSSVGTRLTPHQASCRSRRHSIWPTLTLALSHPRRAVNAGYRDDASEQPAARELASMHRRLYGFLERGIGQLVDVGFVVGCLVVVV